MDKQIIYKGQRYILESYAYESENTIHTSEAIVISISYDEVDSEYSVSIKYHDYDNDDGSYNVTGQNEAKDYFIFKTYEETKKVFDKMVEYAKFIESLDRQHNSVYDNYKVDKFNELKTSGDTSEMYRLFPKGLESPKNYRR